MNKNMLASFGNHRLKNAVMALDPEFEKKHIRICLDLRKELRIVDYVEDVDFCWHGRVIPPGSIDEKGRITLQRPGFYRPVYFVSNCALNGTTDTFIFMEKNGCHFRAENAHLLWHLPRSEMNITQVLLHNHERSLQSDLTTAEKETLKSKFCEAQRLSRSGMKLKRADPDSYGWNKKEVEWVDQAIGVDTTFNELAARSEAAFNSMGRSKTPGDIRRFIDKRLHRNKTAWTVEQRHWIANAAQKSSNWEDISNGFNQYFRASWSSEDLKLFH